MDLGEETDRLNESFEQLEGALTALNFGVSVSVELAPQKSLSFRRTNSGWKLIVDIQEESTDLLATDRSTRVLAAEKVDELFLLLCAEKDRQLSDVSNAIAKVDAVTRKAIELVKRHS